MRDAPQDAQGDIGRLDHVRGPESLRMEGRRCGSPSCQPLVRTSCSHLLFPPLVTTACPHLCSHLLFPPLVPTSCAHLFCPPPVHPYVPTPCPHLLSSPPAPTYCVHLLFTLSFPLLVPTSGSPRYSLLIYPTSHPLCSPPSLTLTLSLLVAPSLLHSHPLLPFHRYPYFPPCLPFPSVPRHPQPSLTTLTLIIASSSPPQFIYYRPLTATHDHLLPTATYYLLTTYLLPTTAD